MFGSESGGMSRAAQGLTEAERTGQLVAQSEMATASKVGQAEVGSGALSGAADLVIEGRVEGRINAAHNVVTIGEHGLLKADVVAKAVVVAGEVQGDIVVSERVELRETCLIQGDVCATRVVAAVGARVVGYINVGARRGRLPAEHGPDRAANVQVEAQVKDAPRSKTAPSADRFRTEIVPASSAREVADLISGRPRRMAKKLPPSSAARRKMAAANRDLP